MAKTRTDVESVVKLIINGEQAKTSMKEITDSVRNYETELRNMKKEDNPQAYKDKAEAIIKMKLALKAARDEMSGIVKETKAATRETTIHKGSITHLTALSSKYRDVIKSATNPDLLTKYNKKLQETEAEIKRLTHLGADGFDEFGDKIKSATDETTKFNLNWRSIAKGVIAGGIFTDLINRIPEYVTKIKDAYAETQKFRTILTTAFNGDTFKADSALKLIQEFAATTPFQLNEITESFIKLVNRGFVPTKKELTEMGDLAASQGKSMDQLVEAILDAQTGEFERLKDLGLQGSKNGDMVAISFRGITHEVKNTDEAIRNAIISFGAMDGISGSMANLSQDIIGMASNIEDSWNKIFVTVGQRSEFFLNGFYRSYGKLMDWINDELLNNKISDQLEDERIKLNALDIQISSTNTKQEDRIKLIKQLQSQYPELLGNLNAEKASNLEISKAIKLVNDQLVNKIILQKKDEEIEKQNQKSAEKKMELLAKEDAIRTEMVKLQKKFPELKATGGTEYEQLKSMILEYRDLYGKQDAAYVIPIGKALSALSKYEQLQQRTRKEQEKGNALIEERTKLMKDLGIEEAKVEEPNRTSGTGTPTPKKAKGESLESKNAKEFERLDKEYEKLGVARLEKQLSANEKEVAQEERKYDELIEKEQAFLARKALTVNQRSETIERISKLETDKGEAVNNIRLKQDEEMTAKITELRAGLTEVHKTELAKQTDSINKFYDGLVKESKGNEAKLKEIEVARAEDIANAEISEKKRLEAEKKRIEDEYKLGKMSDDESSLANINAKYDAELEALKESFSEKLQATQEYQDAVDAINRNRQAEIGKKEIEDTAKRSQEKLDIAKTTADSLFSIMANNRTAETDARISDLERQRDAELSNKNLSEAQKDAINKRYDEKVRAEKKKQWEAERRAAIVQAIINGALGMTKVIAQTGVLAFAFSPVIAAATAAQIAVIAAQKAPKFAKGGFIPEGPSHASGGIKMIDSVTGAMVGEMEGGEPILSKETYRNNKATIDALLYSGQRRNGANISLDTNTLGQAERYYRSGGIAESLSGSVSVPAPVVTVNTEGATLDTRNLEEKLDQLISAANHAWNYRTFEEAQQRIQQIRDSSSG